MLILHKLTSHWASITLVGLFSIKLMEHSIDLMLDIKLKYEQVETAYGTKQTSHEASMLCAGGFLRTI